MRIRTNLASLLALGALAVPCGAAPPAVFVAPVGEDVRFENESVCGTIRRLGHLGRVQLKALKLEEQFRAWTDTPNGGKSPLGSIDGNGNGHPFHLLVKESRRCDLEIVEEGPIRAVVASRMSGVYGKSGPGASQLAGSHWRVETRIVVHAGAEAIAVTSRFELDAPTPKDWFFDLPLTYLYLAGGEAPLPYLASDGSAGVAPDPREVAKAPSNWLNRRLAKPAWIQFDSPSGLEPPPYSLSYVFPAAPAQILGTTYRRSKPAPHIPTQYRLFMYRTMFRNRKEFSISRTIVPCARTRTAEGETVAAHYAKRRDPATGRALGVEAAYVAEADKKSGVVTVRETLGLLRENVVVEVPVQASPAELDTAFLYGRPGSDVTENDEIEFQFVEHKPATQRILVLAPRLAPNGTLKLYLRFGPAGG